MYQVESLSSKDKSGAWVSVSVVKLHSSLPVCDCDHMFLSCLSVEFEAVMVLPVITQNFGYRRYGKYVCKAPRR